MENIVTSKAASIDKPLGNFPKDAAEILAEPISEICNLQSLIEFFLMLGKMLNPNLFSRKTKKSTNSIISLSLTTNLKIH